MTKHLLNKRHLSLGKRSGFEFKEIFLQLLNECYPTHLYVKKCLSDIDDD